MRARAIPVPRRVTTDQGKSLFLALAQKIRAHERGTCAFANSIGAEFGWGSALGRYIGHSGAMNPIIAMFLEELTCSSDVDRSDPEPTAAAQCMLTNEHARRGYRQRLDTRWAQ
jgi:hypothetical protein